MWIWIIIIACVIGAIIGMANSDSGESGEGALGGAMAGGMMAAGCLARLFVTGMCIIFTMLLFSAIFGGCS